MHTRCKLQICCIVAAIFTALAGTLSSEHAAYAQGSENDYVDVGLTLEIPNTNGVPRPKIVVVNNGSRTAYDVVVVVDLVFPEKSHFSGFTGQVVPVGSVSYENNERSLRWTIPALGGLQREEFNVGTTVERTTAPSFDNIFYVHEFYGEVTTSSFESSLHEGNNTSRVWSYKYILTHDQHFQAGGNYTVTVSVDKPSPSPGDTVNFTITADRENLYSFPGVFSPDTPPPIDLKVDVGLTDGLAVTGTPTYASGPLGTSTVPDSVSYSNGVFNIGTLKGGDLNTAKEPIKNSVTLPVTVSSNAVVNEQCLTATLSGNPPPGTGPYDDDILDNVAKVCLASVESSVSSQFNIYPCVGNSNLPCDNSDDVRVRAIGEVGGTKAILGPGTALVHSPNKLNREYDSHANSLNSGDIVSWQIPVTWDASEINAVHTQWNNLRDGFTVSGTSGGAPPGKVHIRAFEGDSSEIIYKMTSATGWTGEDTVGYNPGASGNGPFDYTAEFEKLGTYKLQFTAKLTRATRDGDEDCDPNTADPPVNQRFCGTETYIFHFGPMAELEVRGGGASSHVPADRSALAIVAVNNGPDEPSSGALVTGLPKGAQVFHISQGRYDGSTGVWSTGRLKVRDYYRSAGMSEPTLVLGASAGDTARVSIASAKDYEVCVGPKSNPGDLAHTTKSACEAVTNASWNSVPVYDYKPDNNSATIRAARGTGGRTVQPTPSRPVGGPVAPANLTAQTGTTTVKWDAVGLLYGLPVVRYEVQELQGSDWRLLDRVTTHNEYAVMQPRGRSYRVRAVNAAGAVGPWSQSTAEVAAGLPGSPLNLRAQADGNNAIDVSWDAPDDIGGSAITGYTVEWSPNAPGSWRSRGHARLRPRVPGSTEGLSVGAR